MTKRNLIFRITLCRIGQAAVVVFNFFVMMEIPLLKLDFFTMIFLNFWAVLLLWRFQVSAERAREKLRKIYEWEKDFKNIFK